MSVAKFRVLIVGAGCTGLVIAQALQKAGVAYLIFDQRSGDDNPTRDWGLALHWGQKFLLDCLPDELRSKLRACLVNPSYQQDDDGYPFCDGSTGKVLKVVTGAHIQRYSRRKLRQLLATNVNIQYCTKVVDFARNDQCVSVHLEHGGIENGDLLIGADGGNSKIREFLVGPARAKPIDTGLTMINFAHTYGAEQTKTLQAIHPIFKAAFLPGSKSMNALAALDIPDSSHPETWRYQNWFSWKGAPTPGDLEDSVVRMRYFKGHAVKLAEPWRTAALSIDDYTVLPLDPLRIWSPEKWTKCGGRITLAGDAAHSMPPFRGQGLNNAMEDAYRLVEAIKLVFYRSKSIYAAIDEYDEELVSRGAREVKLSLEQAMLAHDWTTLEDSPYFKDLGMHKVNEGPKGSEKEL